MKLRYSVCMLFLLAVFALSTQSEEHQHNYSEWTFEGAQMHRRCEICDLSETQEIDRELYLESLLSGYWEADSYKMLLDGKTADALSLMASIHFDDGHQLAVQQATADDMHGTWRYCDYKFNEDTHTYSAFFDCGNTSIPFELTVSPQGAPALSLKLNNRVMLFVQAPEAASAFATNWCIADSKTGGKQGNPENWLTLRDDRTVSGYFNGDVEGNWYITTTKSSDSSGEYEVVIENTSEGGKQYLSGTYWAASDRDAPLVLNKQGFVTTTPERIEQIIAAKTILLGTWKSIYIEEFERTYTGASSITFNEDHTFALRLDKKYTGLWGISEFTDFNSDRSILYQLIFDGSREKFHGELTHKDGLFGAGNNEFIVHGTPKNEMLKAFFACSPDDANAFIEQAVGTWQLLGYSSSHSDDFLKINELTFSQDGTLTAETNTKEKGLWYPVSVELDTESDRMLKYHVFLSDKMFEMYITNGEELYLTSVDNTSDDLHFQRSAL